jgi:hypothetical protein
MNVRLPNGVVIENVPEGATKEEIMQKAVKAGLATAKDFGVASGPDKFKKEGVSAGGLDPSDIDDIDPMAISEAGVDVGTKEAKKGAIRNFLQGMSFNLSDEMEALARSAFGDETYDEAVSEIRGEMKEFEQANQGASLVQQGVGSIFNPAMYGKVPQAVEKMATGAKTAKPLVEAAWRGGTVGGAYGFGAGEGAIDSVEEAALGVGVGTASAGVLTKAGNMITSLGSKLSGPLSEVEKKVRRYGINPVVEQLQSAKNAAYKAIDDAADATPFFTRDEASEILTRASKAAEKQHYYQFGTGDYKQVERARSMLQGFADKGDALTAQQTERMRQNLNRMYKNADDQERIIMSDIIKEFDNVVDAKMAQSNLPTYKVARELNQQFKFVDMLDRELGKITLKGVEGQKALQNSMRRIASDESRMATMTPSQQKAIIDLAEGRGLPKIANFLSKLTPTNSLANMAAHAIMLPSTGGYVLLTALATGGVARQIADKKLRIRVSKLIKDVGGIDNIKKASKNPESASLILNGFTSDKIMDELFREE